MKLKISENQASNLNLNFKESLARTFCVFWSTLAKNLMLKYNFMEINDFRETFWQKLANLYNVIYAINLFSVKIDKKKLQSGDTPLQTYHRSLLKLTISKK